VSARFDAFLIEGSRLTPRVGRTPPVGFSRLEGSFDPRIAVSWRAHERLTIDAAAGAYHQAPEPTDLSAVFGTPALVPSRAVHASLGESLRITKALSLDVVAFARTMSDLPVRSRLADPKLARALVQDGEGRSYGAQLMVRQKIARGLFGWIAYTISRSERRYVTDDRWRLFDYDQPHVLAAVVSKTIGAWSFGARFRYATGAPRTPIAGAFYDLRGDQYQPIFGAQNTTRLPDFYQLDLRIDRRFAIAEHASLDLYLDLENVTFHQNREEIVYAHDFSSHGYINGLPALALAGVRVEL
jgi:outer membrane receptor protein involved in Fe transport